MAMQSIAREACGNGRVAALERARRPWRRGPLPLATLASTACLYGALMQRHPFSASG